MAASASSVRADLTFYFPPTNGTNCPVEVVKYQPFIGDEREFFKAYPSLIARATHPKPFTCEGTKDRNSFIRTINLSECFAITSEVAGGGSETDVPVCVKFKNNAVVKVYVPPEDLRGTVEKVNNAFETGRFFTLTNGKSCSALFDSQKVATVTYGSSTLPSDMHRHLEAGRHY